MPRIIQPMVSPRGRVIVLSGATLWLLAAMLLSAAPDGAVAEETRPDAPAYAALERVSAFEQVRGVEGMLYKPKLAISSEGVVHLIDEGTARVIRLSPGGEIQSDLVFGGKGAGPGELMGPKHLAVDAAGNVFVADLRLGRVSKFAPDGTYLTSTNVPRAASLLIDSKGRVLVYPGRGTALLERFDNDLEVGEPLLEKSDEHLHGSRLGVLMAIDENDRLYLLDQTGPRILVLEGDGLQPVDEWELDAPGLLESIEARMQRGADPDKNGYTVVAVTGVQAMALDRTHDQIVFAYLISPSPDVRYTRVAAYSLDGDLRWSGDRDSVVYSSVFTPSGELLEADMERVQVWGPQTATTSSDN